MFDLRPRLVHSLKNRQAFFNATVDLPCPVCGQSVAFAPRVSGVLCGHCGSPLHRQPDDATPVGPTGMLPFRLSEQDAQARLAAAATEPAAAAAMGQPSRLRRVYVPYWHLAAHIATSWRVVDQRKVDVSEHADGNVSVDYDEALPAVPPDGDCSALTGLQPQLGAEAGAYESARLAEVEVRPPTVVLSDAWSAARQRWETRLSELAERENGGLGFSEEIEFILTEYSNERAAMLLVPVYLPEPTTDAAPASFAVDGYSGNVIRPRPQSAAPEAEADGDASETPQVPEAFIGGAALVVIAGVLLLFGLWFAQRLWWY